MNYNKLTKEEVLRVANLAKLHISESDIEKYIYRLHDVLKLINEINEIDIKTDEMLISSTNNKNVFRKDVIGNMLEINEVLKSANDTSGDYVEVVGVINE